MNILLVAQCNKRALTETRRIVDQFAERKGERTWQTAITLEGLNTLRKLLRKTARRNTAVACHWIKSANQTELLWIVGNLRRFNTQGSVPTHTSERDIIKSKDENQWHSVEAISLLAAIAGLFHDFGKANKLFQRGLRHEGKTFQPYRHEWVSLRLFCAWVGEQSDAQWLTSLRHISQHDECEMLARLHNVSHDSAINPFKQLPPLAATVGWLILSHHRLPVYLPKHEGSNGPQLSRIDDWLTRQLTPLWNSLNQQKHHWTEEELNAVWCFPSGTPLRSHSWRLKAQQLAKRALNQPSLLRYGQLEQRFTLHMARLVLMLADHHYSSLPAVAGWQDGDYQVFANTDRQTAEIKQHLDEHNIGVAQNALLLGRSLPHIRKTLPAITRHKGFKQRSEKERFRWQDKAWDLTSALRERSVSQGFFGVNMASTGCGKTFANARIMYALADEQQGCRFTVALGLRTLTMQTGDALREKLSLQEDDLAVLLGSQAVQQLRQLNADEEDAGGTGSASSEALFAGHQYVSYDGSLDDGRLSRWLSGKETFNKLLSAPVLVTTIDHLMPATESLRGGRQIAPMLRLLTADLVLDEPDDFDIDDLPALCRLVNWAGMLGSRVLLSSATLPPALVQALFNAYSSGRKDFQLACGQPETAPAICCAWFDEHNAVQADIPNAAAFKQQHEAFVVLRIPHLLRAEALRLAKLIALTPPGGRSGEALDSMAATIGESIRQLHLQHHNKNEAGKAVSLGVVRMANINPLIAVAKRLLATASAEDMRIHYCVYHSQHPLAVRSYIEARLDETLTRYNEEAIWKVTEIRQALESFPERHHAFVVLATSVAEVGRDHDYDWAIAEPSSMRSLIQLAGRVQRHRQRAPTKENIHILQQNFRALRQTDLTQPAYCRPGFESSAGFMLHSHHLDKLLEPEQYRSVNAVPRIQERESAIKKSPFCNWVDLEHSRLWVELHGVRDGKNYCAALWWRKQASWCGELQRRKPFRQTLPESQYYLWLEEEGDKPSFMSSDNGDSGWKESDAFRYEQCAPAMAAGVSAWIEADIESLYTRLADKTGMELREVSQRFGEVSLRDGKDQQEAWHYHPLLGVFGALD